MSDPWEVRYKPKRLRDVILPEEWRRQLQDQIAQESFTSRLFCGPPGTGKTSVAKLLCRAMEKATGWDGYELGGKQAPTMAAVEGILEYACAAGGVVLIDEADKMHPETQTRFLSIYNEVSEHCMFVLTTNYPDRLHEGIRSRLREWDFGLEVPAASYLARMKEILKAENAALEDAALLEVIEQTRPDVRKMLQRVQECVEGSAYSSPSSGSPSLLSKEEWAARNRSRLEQEWNELQEELRGHVAALLEGVDVIYGTTEKVKAREAYERLVREYTSLFYPEEEDEDVAEPVDEVTETH